MFAIHEDENAERGRNFGFAIVTVNGQAYVASGTVWNPLKGEPMYG
jgi:hypothetical protein